MKYNSFLYLAFIILLFSTNEVDAQKCIDRIHDYYKADAYYLTIKKIKELKPRLQSRSDVRYMLADCYWKVGFKERTVKLYKGTASAARVPGAIKKSYDWAFCSNFKTNLLTPIEVKSKQFICISNEQSESAPPIPALTLTIPKMNKQVQEAESEKELFTVAVVNMEKEDQPMPPVSQASGPSISLLPVDVTVEKNSPSTLFDLFLNNDSKTFGKYRIRIPIKIDEEANELQLIQSLQSVSVSKWADKKIILAGYFDSFVNAQAIVDLYLKDKYKHAVVVTKVGVQYKSVRPNDYVVK